MKSGWIMLGIVSVVYAILYFINAEKFMQVLFTSLSVLKIIAPIIVVVGVIMFITEYYVDDEKLIKHLDTDRGVKAWFIALVGGILSHGPSYVWYPMLQNFREKGVRDSLIITFLYARSIKIPWLPMMVVYFGMQFTAVFMFYIIVGAVAQGMLSSLFFTQKESFK